MSNPYRALNNAGNPTGLLLPKVFNDEVVKAFQMQTPMWTAMNSVANVRTVQGGETFNFTMESMDTANDPVFHVPGSEIVGRAREFIRRTITTDDILVDSIEVNKYDEIVDDIGITAGIASSLVSSIGMRMERQINVVHVNAARAGAETKNGRTIHPGGFVTPRVAADVATAYPNSSTGADRLDEDFHALARNLDLRFVPREGRTARISSYVADVLRHRPQLFINDYKAPNNYNARFITQIAGFDIMVDPNLDSLNTNIVDPKYAKYSANCTPGAGFGQPVALIACGVGLGRAPIGIAMRYGIQGHTEMFEKTNVRFFKAELNLGIGIMHPYCAASIEVRSS
jgi:hypothetical protein